MAGEAQTSKFMLGTATVMLGAPADLHKMTPATHSVGLVKNFRIQGQPGYTDLTQGVKQTKVFSVMTSNDITASMEIYEYTLGNLMYSLGLEGYSAATTVSTTVATAAAEKATAVTLTAATGLAVGDFLALDSSAGTQVRKITAIKDATVTVDALGAAVAAGAVARQMSVVEIGSKKTQPFLAARIEGELADGSKVTILCPKIRITNGFSLGFTTDNFDNMPYEFTFYDLMSGDALYSEFKNSQAKLLV
jgi:hypothetical protein